MKNSLRWFWVVIVFVIFIVVGLFFGRDEIDKSSNVSPQTLENSQ